MGDWKVSFLMILIGEELLDSMAVITASFEANPFSFLSICGIASRSVSTTKSGRHCERSEGVVPGVYEGRIWPIVYEGRFAKKSPRSGTGAK